MMIEILRTNNPVELSWAKSVLENDGIPAFIFDLNINFLEGNIGAFPRRLMVNEVDKDHAFSVLKEKRIELEEENLDG